MTKAEQAETGLIRMKLFLAGFENGTQVVQNRMTTPQHNNSIGDSHKQPGEACRVIHSRRYTIPQRMLFILRRSATHKLERHLLQWHNLRCSCAASGFYLLRCNWKASFPDLGTRDGIGSRSPSLTAIALELRVSGL
jgi:hypothetical protein